MTPEPLDPKVHGLAPAPGQPGRGLVVFYRTALAVVAVALGVLLGATLGVKQVTMSAIDSSALVDEADPSRLYFLGIRALSKDLEDSDVLDPFRGTPYELSEEAIARLIIHEFSDEEVAHKAWEVHSRLVSYGRTRYRDIDSIPAFSVGIVDERESLERALTGHLVGTFRALPECGLVGDLDALWSGFEKKVGLADANEVLKDLPECRPTDMMADPIVAGFRSGVSGRLAGADSTRVFPRSSWEENQYRQWLSDARSLVTRPTGFLVLALVTTLVFVLATTATSGAWYGGVTLLATGVTLLLGPTALEWLQHSQPLEQLVLGRALEPYASVGDAWLALIFDFEAGAIALAARRLTAAGLFALALSGCFLLGGILQAELRRRERNKAPTSNVPVFGHERIESAA